MIRGIAALVALLLAASLYVNIRYVAVTPHGQDVCPASCAKLAREAPRCAPDAGRTSTAQTRLAPVQQSQSSPEPAPSTLAQSTPVVQFASGSDNRFIIVTFATKGVVDFALNWVLHVRDLELPHMLGAMDDKMLEVAERWGIPAHAVHRDKLSGSSSRDSLSGVSKAEQEGNANLRGSNLGFASLGVLKTLFIQALLREERDVLVSDTDTAWFRDPRPLVYGRMPRYADFSHADLLISTDCIDSADDESESNSGCWYTPVQKNTGMMFFRANNRSLRFVREWEERLVQYTKCPPDLGARDGKCEGYNDQNMLNEMIDGRPLGSSVWHDGKRNGISNQLRRERCAHAHTTGGRFGVPLEEGHVQGSARVFAVCMPDKLDHFVVGVLPTLYFANGHSFFVQQRFLSTGIWPTAVHVTFTWGDSAAYAFGKLQRMKDFGMWKLPLITYGGERAEDLVDVRGGGGAAAAAAPNDQRMLTQRRFLLVHDPSDRPAVVPFDKADYDQRAFQHVRYQLTVRARLKHALALALALNRTVILPKFWCYCDRYFYRLEACMIPGGHHATQLPFECPFDHIFDSSHWYALPNFIGDTEIGRRFRRLGFEGRVYGEYIRRAPQVANSKAEVWVDSGSEGAKQPPAGQASLMAKLPAGANDATLAKAASDYSHINVLQISLQDAEMTMRGFRAQRDADDFNKLVRWLFENRVAYCQKECRFADTMYDSVKRKERDPCVWLDGKDKLAVMPVVQDS